jgi:hypothetical protein
MRRALLFLIRGYQAGVSPTLGARCRYEPTCSVYAYQAIERFGAIRGSWMGLRRLVRCRPGVAGGYDPVPDPAPGKKQAAASDGHPGAGTRHVA